MSEDRISFDNNIGGGIKYNLPSSVSVEDLMKNKIGITLLLDNLNSLTKQTQKLTAELEDLKCTRLSLPITIYLAVCNLIGTVLVAIGVNLLTSNILFYVAIVLVALGGLAVISSSLIPIIHHWYAGKDNRARR